MNPAAEPRAVAAAPHRIERLRAWMAGGDVDCVVVAGPVAVNHLLGYWRYFGGECAAVIDADGASTLVVAHDEGPSAAELSSAGEVRTYGRRGFGLVPDQRPLLAAALAQLPALARGGGGGVGFAADTPGLEDHLGELLAAPLQSAESELARIRLVKDADELARVRRSYDLAWEAQAAVAARAEAGASEIELFTAGMSAAQLSAGQPIEFLGDLLCGARSAEVCAPIRVASRASIGEGEAIVSDLVVGCEGYWGDTAETYAAGANEEVEGVRGQLRAILADCAGLLTPGRPAAEVFHAMAGAIAEAFPAGEFPHHGGHGLGLGSYEDPHVIPGETASLAAGMVIALEPGVYFPGRFGARVEEVYVVAEGGGRELRSAAEPREDTQGRM